MKTILITGAAGFIGSNLSLSLLKDKKNKIIGVDNFVSGDKDNIANLDKFQNFSFIKHTIVKPLLVKEKIDEIYNLACPASPVAYYNHPIETLDVCSRGVSNILKLAHKNKAKFLHTSTSEGYGDPKIHPQGPCQSGYYHLW